ncbi:MAG: nucleoside triphosphate pyrophosphohydrolase [Clostridia bacterium]|nr:nucleoside triphosphate pyrophosphohydrolase [Clostridia bacterium]
MEKIFNKLVRDKIPEIIEANGEIARCRILDKQEFKAELEKKLFEEYNEVLESAGNERVEELADMLEILKALAEVEGSNLEQVIQVAEEKAKKRGAFEKRIFLEKTIKQDK